VSVFALKDWLKYLIGALAAALADLLARITGAL